MDMRGRYSHVAIVVDDLTAAIAELEALLGITWETPRDREMHGVPFRMAYSRGEPPWIELLERSDGTPFDTLGLHHVGVWSEDHEADKRRMADAGLELELDGVPIGRVFSLHRAPTSGLRLELVDAAVRDEFNERLNPSPQEP
jgi:catechol 2,3-dioxygenase-like lactoylglutathione lyase family enzyme